MYEERRRRDRRGEREERGQGNGIGDSSSNRFSAFPCLTHSLIIHMQFQLIHPSLSLTRCPLLFAPSRLVASLVQWSE